MKSSELTTLKEEIEKIKEYVASEVCKKCEEMYDRLKECEQSLEEHTEA